MGDTDEAILASWFPLHTGITLSTPSAAALASPTGDTSNSSNASNSDQQSVRSISRSPSASSLASSIVTIGSVTLATDNTTTAGDNFTLASTASANGTGIPQGKGIARNTSRTDSPNLGAVPAPVSAAFSRSPSFSGSATGSLAVSGATAGHSGQAGAPAGIPGNSSIISNNNSGSDATPSTPVSNGSASLRLGPNASADKSGIAALCGPGSANDIWSLTTKTGLACDAAAAVAFLHSHRILHRDIKSPNYIVAADGTLKLTDFGISRIVMSSQSNVTDKGAKTSAVLSSKRCFTATASPIQSAVAVAQTPAMLLAEACAGKVAPSPSADTRTVSSPNDSSSAAALGGKPSVTPIVSALATGSDADSVSSGNSRGDSNASVAAVSTAAPLSSNNGSDPGTSSSSISVLSPDNASLSPLTPTVTISGSAISNSNGNGNGGGGALGNGTHSRLTAYVSPLSASGGGSAYPTLPSSSTFTSSSLMTSMMGTASWMAPEVATGEYGLPSDVFSLGIVLWEIYASQAPSFDALATIRAANATATAAGVTRLRARAGSDTDAGKSAPADHSSLSGGLCTPSFTSSDNSGGGGGDGGAGGAGEWLELPMYCPWEVQAIVRACTQTDPRARPLASQVHLALQSLLKRLVSVEAQLATERRVCQSKKR